MRLLITSDRCSHRMVDVMGRMDERERGHEATLQAMEKDMSLRQQALEVVKKKVRG